VYGASKTLSHPEESNVKGQGLETRPATYGDVPPPAVSTLAFAFCLGAKIFRFNRVTLRASSPRTITLRHWPPRRRLRQDLLSSLKLPKDKSTGLKIVVCQKRPKLPVLPLLLLECQVLAGVPKINDWSLIRCTFLVPS
jgi:hypothetical protein